MLIKHPSATPVTTRNGVRSEVWNLPFGIYRLDSPVWITYRYAKRPPKGKPLSVEPKQFRDRLGSQLAHLEHIRRERLITFQWNARFRIEIWNES